MELIKFIMVCQEAFHYLYRSSHKIFFSKLLNYTQEISQIQRQEIFKFILLFQKITIFQQINFLYTQNILIEFTQIFATLRSNFNQTNPTNASLFINNIILIIVSLQRFNTHSEFFYLINIKISQKNLCDFTTQNQFENIEVKLWKKNLFTLLKKYLDKKFNEEQICQNCEKMILFNKMQKHLKRCKQRYDLEDYVEKVDAQINAKLQDVNSYIAKIKKLQLQREKQNEKIKQTEKKKNKWQKSKEFFIKKQYKTSIGSYAPKNQFENDQDDDQRQANSGSQYQQPKSIRKLKRKYTQLKQNQLNEYLKLIEQIKNVGTKIKNTKLWKKSELYRSLKNIKDFTKPKLKQLNVYSDEINHILNLLMKRMDLLLKQRRYDIEIKKQKGDQEKNSINFINHEFQNIKNQDIVIDMKRKLTQQYYSEQESSPRSTVEKQQVTLNDFKILRKIGKGNYGQIYLVKKKKTGVKYALKKIKIENSKYYTDISNLKTENNVFQVLNSPYIVKALYSFSQGDFHYFVMQYIPNGDLADLLENQMRLYESQAKQSLAQIVSAIQYLHQNQIIHKDIKPQNIVIDAEGHMKLTDFGLSHSGMLKKKIEEQKNQNLSNFILKELKKKQKNQKDSEKPIAGTPYYMAPQVINGQKITYMADWWSFGILMYQILIGIPPFSGKNPFEIKKNIYNQDKWPSQVKFGSDQYEEISYQAKDLIDKLLIIDPKKRIGNEVQDIKSHNFFYGIDWANIRSPNFEILELLKQSEKINIQEQQDGYNTEDQNKKQVSFTSNQNIKFSR